MKLHLAWVLVDRVHCTFGNCAKVREKTFDPGVAEEKRSAWVRSFDSDALLSASTVPPSAMDAQLSAEIPQSDAILTCF